MLLIRVVAATLLMSAPAFAQSAQPAAPAAPAQAPAEKKICRTGEVPTGSMMAPKRTCRTAAEWKALDQQAAHAARGHTNPDPALSGLTPVN